MKHARPMFYINCGYRDLCYCYSKITRHHYCCSCDVGACFPAHARAATPTGTPTSMQNLRTGDQVLAVNEAGAVVTTTILGFLDRRPRETALYLTLRTALGQNLTLSPNHVLFKSAPNSTQPVSVFGSDISVGDVIFSANQTGLEPAEVVSVEHEVTQGAYVPLTQEGTLVVEGAMVSCYASYKHSLAHKFLAPARTFPALLYLKPGFVSRIASSVKHLAGTVAWRLSGILRGIVGHVESQATDDRIPEPSGGHSGKHMTAEGLEGPTTEGGDCADDEGEGEAYFVSVVKVVGRLLYREEQAAPQVLQVRPSVPHSGLLQLLRLPAALPRVASALCGLLVKSW